MIKTKDKYIQDLETQNLILETQVRHLTNDLRLTREENENSTKNYFEIYSKMESIVEERTRELKAVQKQLEEKSQELQIMLDSTPGMIFYKDTEQRFIRVNKKFSEMMGLPACEIIGKTFTELFPNAAAPGLETDLEVIRRGKPILKSTEFFETPKGVRQISVDKIPSKDNEGRVIGIIGFGLDETDLKKMEEEKKALEAQLQQSQKMEAIGTLAGGIAHDFNNILAAIMGYTELACIKLGEDSLARANLQEVLKASQRAKKMVSQILSFSRQTDHELRPLQLKPIFKEALKLLRASLPATIEIHQEIHTRTGTIMGDPTQLHQLLVNLCTNAHHAMQENGGRLEVRMDDLDFTPGDILPCHDLSPGPYLRLTVKDTGHGMEQAVMSRIFEPYFTTKGPGEGTGMGLAVVHGIVTAHGGTIHVASKPGKGSTFQIYLPRIEYENDDMSKKPSRALPRGQERILFVDDEQALVDIGQEMLKHLEYQVVSRTSSVEALALFETKPYDFDMIITDQTMPNMTGETLAKKVISIRSDIPIILCTGFSERISESKAKEIGIKAFLMKPLVMEDLAVTIRKIFQKHRSS